MEDQKLGKHCTLQECRQIDWMPIECKYCHLVFCAEHFSIDSHHCKEVDKHFNKVLICPVCEESFKQNLKISEQDNLAIHQATNCKGRAVRKESCCSQPKCRQKLTELNSYNCKACASRYCLKHKLHEDHSQLVRCH